MVRCSIVLRSLGHNINDLLHSSQYFLSSSRTVLIQVRVLPLFKPLDAIRVISCSVLVQRAKTRASANVRHLPLSTNEKYSLSLRSPFRHRNSNSAPFDYITADCGAAGVAMTQGPGIHMSTAACVSYGLDSAKQVQMVVLSSRFTACYLDWIAQNLHSLDSQRQTIPLPTRTFREIA